MSLRYGDGMFVRTLVAIVVIGALVACNNKPKGTEGSAPASVTSSAASGANLKEGDPAPDVEMTLQDGRKLKLSSLKGQIAVLYFYPKDQTQGCTIEAQNFRDRFDELKKAGITVIGVSTQDAASHKAFIEKEKLPFDLAVDEDKALAHAFGVPLIGPGLHSRQTFLVGKDGAIKKVWRDVKPKDHADEVLAAARS